MALPVVFAIASLVLSVATMIYSYYLTRKSGKKNKIEPTQLDGSIVDEGQSFSDVAGSPHMYGFITWIGNQSSEPIKSKGGKK